MERDLKDSQLYEAQYGFKEKQSTVRFLLSLLLILFLFFGIRAYWTSSFGGVVVDGSSMERTLQSGEQLLMRYTRDGKRAKRGDVIVVHVENYPEIQEENQNKADRYKLKYLVKRLIAVEGDSLYCEDGQIYIKYVGAESFVKLDEPYAYYNPYYGKKTDYDFAEYTVGKGEVFFLGDNRMNSVDSRYQEYNENSDGSKSYYSHLKDKLYKRTDIIGIVPAWAIEKQAVLEKIFFNSIAARK